MRASARNGRYSLKMNFINGLFERLWDWKNSKNVTCDFLIKFLGVFFFFLNWRVLLFDATWAMWSTSKEIYCTVTSRVCWRVVVLCAFVMCIATTIERRRRASVTAARQQWMGESKRSRARTVMQWRNVSAKCHVQNYWITWRCHPLDIMTTLWRPIRCSRVICQGRLYYIILNRYVKSI